RPTPKALLMAVGSGAMIGAFLILIDLTPDDSGLVPLIANRAVNGIIMFTVIGVLVVVAARRSSRVGGGVSVRVPPTDAGTPAPIGMLSPGWRAGLWLAIACGVIDALANSLLLLGLRLGELSVMAV